MGLPTNFLEVIIFRCSTFAFCVESGSLAGDPFSFFTAGFMANHLPFLNAVASAKLLVASRIAAVRCEKPSFVARPRTWTHPSLRSSVLVRMTQSKKDNDPEWPHSVIP